jgi:histone deacetylase 6
LNGVCELIAGTVMDANSPVEEGELEYASSDDAVNGKEMEKEVVHPLAAFLAMHGITAGEDDDDDAESDDEEWRPKMLCTNCTMPNREDEELCSQCHESLHSHVLEHPLLGGPTTGTTTSMCVYVLP